MHCHTKQGKTDQNLSVFSARRGAFNADGANSAAILTRLDLQGRALHSIVEQTLRYAVSLRAERDVLRRTWDHFRVDER